MSRNKKIIIAIFVIAVIALAVFFAYKLYYRKICCSEPIVDENEQLATTTEKLLVAKNLIDGYKLYKNAKFGFEIQYPQTWAISEENIENVRGESTRAFYFSPMGGSASGGKKFENDLRFVILPRDGLSYGLPDNGESSEVLIGGLAGSQTKWTLSDGRRLWLLYPKYALYNWSEDIGRIDIQSSATDPIGDTAIFEKMLNSFKLSK